MNVTMELTALEEAEYREASERLRAWRRADLLRVLAPVPKGAPAAKRKPDPLTIDPLGIAAGRKRRRR